MDALRQIPLPDVWPTRANSDPEWWRQHGKQIKVEDQLVQILCDLLLERNPAVTGSARSTWNLESLKATSQNQKKLKAACLLMRDNNPAPLLAILRDEERNGICYLEQFARYQPRFHTIAAVAALLWLDRHGMPTPHHALLRAAIIRWLGEERWCLEHFEWPEDGGPIWWIGCRRAG